MNGCLSRLPACPGSQITWNELFTPASELGFKSAFLPIHFGLW